MSLSLTNSNCNSKINVLLVDDDNDDYQLFLVALLGQTSSTFLQRVNGGDELFDLLNNTTNSLPQVIFLDVNMNGKNGYDCLIEMKASERLQNIPIVMYSTCYDENVADVLFEMGANYFIKKPRTFDELKKVLQKALSFITNNVHDLPAKHNFLISV